MTDFRIDDPPEPKPSINLQFMDDPELFKLINRYRRSTGWTWKRIFLVGIAEAIVKQGNNPDLVVRIVDYLDNKR